MCHQAVLVFTVDTNTTGRPMTRITESDFPDQLETVQRAAMTAEAARREADGAFADLLDTCEQQIRAGVPVLYVAKAAGINRTRLYRLLGRIPTPTRKAS